MFYKSSPLYLFIFASVKNERTVMCFGHNLDVHGYPYITVCTTSPASWSFVSDSRNEQVSVSENRLVWAHKPFSIKNCSIDMMENYVFYNIPQSEYKSIQYFLPGEYLKLHPSLRKAWNGVVCAVLLFAKFYRCVYKLTCTQNVQYI